MPEIAISKSKYGENYKKPCQQSYFLFSSFSTVVLRQASTASMTAALSGRPGDSDAIQPLLIKAPTLKPKQRGQTALIVAAKYFWTGTVKLLLEKGANIEAKDQAVERR